MAVIFAMITITAFILLQQYHASVARERAENFSAHTQEVLIEKAAVLSALQDAETGQRGFLLTMRPEYLEPYDRGQTDLLPSINRLAELTIDNPSQQERISRLRSVAEAKLSALATAITAAKSGHHTQALDIVLSGDGKALMDQAHLAEFPADDVMSNVHEFNAMAEQKGLRLRVHPCQETTRSDPILLKRIVRNLTVNAIKYTDRGGVVVACRQRGNSLRIDVWDSGRGIPKDRSAQIFEEFYRGDEAGDPGGGLGIGLSIVTRVARLLGHRVTVRSREGHGSLFAVTVPLVQPSPSQPS